MNNPIKLVSQDSVSINYTKHISIPDIVEAIQGGYWEEQISGFDLRPFVGQTEPNGPYHVEDTNRIQVRVYEIDYAFIRMKINYIKKTGDESGLKKPVLLYFQESYVHPATDRVYESDSYYLLDDNHGVLIKAGSDIFEYDSNVINFKIHLDSKWSSVFAVANGLNYSPYQTIGVDDKDIQLEWEELIEERYRDGKDPKPTIDDRNDFMNRYPHLTGATLGDWFSHHQEYGGRSKTGVKSYTKTALAAVQATYRVMQAYEDYAVIHPCTYSTIEGTVVGTIVREGIKKGSKKILIPLYAKNITQADVLENTTGEKYKGILSKLEAIRNYCGLDRIDVVVMQTRPNSR